MRITMVKKQLENGQPCDKCAQTEEMLRRRDLWGKIDEVIWAVEGDDDSPGSRVARSHGIKVAPFFVLAADDGSEAVYTSPLRMIRDHLSEPAPKTQAAPAPPSPAELPALAEEFSTRDPEQILTWAYERFAQGCPIAFSGSHDVILIDMTARLKLPYRFIHLDTGRLHDATYVLLDEIRRHYGVTIETYLPDQQQATQLVNQKGPNSFLRDGHLECCSIRKVEPMRRALADSIAWISGQRRQQNPTARASLPIIQEDPAFGGPGGSLIKLNPLAHWDTNQVWSYIRKHGVPYNKLHDQGYASIGCKPCTRPIRPDQHIGEARWWWEGESPKECGLHGLGEGI